LRRRSARSPASGATPRVSLAGESSAVANGGAEGDVPAPWADSAPGVGRNVTALAVSQVITWTMTLLWTLVVPRALGPAAMGLIFAALAVSGVLGIFLGFAPRNYLVREAVVDQAGAPKLFGTAVMLRLALAPVFAFAVVAYGELANYSGEANAVLYLAATAMVLTLLVEPLQAGFQAIERMQYLAYSEIVSKTGQSVLGIGAAVLGLGAIGVSATTVVVAAVVILLNLVWLLHSIPIDLRTSAERIVSMFKRSAAYWAYGVFGMAYLWIDTLMLSLMTRPEVVGWYGAPLRLFQTVMVVPVLISTVLLPRFVDAFKTSPERLVQTARTPLEVVVVLGALASASAFVLADPMIPLLYGSAYTDAIPVMMLLGLCILPVYVSIILSQVLIAADRQRVWTFVMAGAAAGNALLNLVLIPATEDAYDNGAIGASASLLATEAVMVSIGFAVVGKNLFDRAAARRCLLALGAATAMCCVTYATRDLGTVASTAAGVITFTVLVVTLRIATRAELVALWSAARQARRQRASAE
jgi:O-antigen/teichoic acid export membrane protein